MDSRAIDFERVENFRDYGSYAMAGGRRLRARWLYRSAHFGDATSSDLLRLMELGLAGVVDLRGPGERLRAPNLAHPDLRARIFHTDLETGALAPHIEVAVKGVRTVPEARVATQLVFADMPCRPVIIAVLSSYFTALAETDGPTLIHCTAGKDRTGLAVALLHTALGVHWDDVMADFLLTNTAGRYEERIASGIAMMRRNFGAHLSEDIARTLVTVEPSYLAAAFAAVSERFGSVDSYLRDVLHITDELRDRICARIVA